MSGIGTVTFTELASVDAMPAGDDPGAAHSENAALSRFPGDTAASQSSLR